MKKLQIIPKGALFVFTAGAYSDYGVLALCRANENIDADKLRNEYLEEHPEQSRDYHFNENEFMVFVSGRGLFEELEYMDFHLADYSSVDEMGVFDND